MRKIQRDLFNRKWLKTTYMTYYFRLCAAGYKVIACGDNCLIWSK